MRRCFAWFKTLSSNAQLAQEDAQAMVFFAVVAMLLAFTTGLAVEGSRLYSDYRRLQSAADMSAIVGAQDLPCNLGASSCITAAEQLACTTAAGNGISTCSNGTFPGAAVPPQSCSPYNAMDYGNDNGDTGGNANCKTVSTGVSYYDYIEVQLQDNLGTVPIFNTPITLSAHAIARHGVPSPKDYAVSQLDPSGSLNVNGGGEYFVNGSSFANGALSLTSNTVACEGGFFTASSSAPTTETTYAGGEAGFAPPACYTSTGGTPTADNPANFDGNLPQITDAYCGSYTPPISLLDTSTYGLTTSTADCNTATASYTSMPNCTDCNNYGYYYVSQAASGKAKDVGWFGGGTTSAPSVSYTGGGKTPNIVEMFPGVYQDFQLGDGDEAFLNPGVYTFVGNVSLDKGEMCVFGAPACLGGSYPGGTFGTTTIPSGTHCNSSTWNWKPNDSEGNAWYYYCSPYGFWDTGLKRPASAPSGSTGVAATLTCGGSPAPTYGPSCTAPTWWDYSAKAKSSVQLNGVTFYLAKGYGTLQGTGAGNSTLDQYLASPNPCPGTGSGWSSGTKSVSFNTGDPSAYYSEASGTLAYANGFTTSPTTTTTNYIYPSMNLKITGECSPDTLEVWPGEMGGVGQHVHFFIFDRSQPKSPSTSGIKLAGNQGQAFDGIFYTPHELADLTGAGSSSGGPPWILGQIVAWDIKFGGNSAMDLVYRPCNDTEDPCTTGLGTQLIQ